MRKSFQFRVFRNIILFVLVMSACFGYLYASRQKSLLEHELEAHGTSVAQMLAGSLRLGLLTESEDFLMEPIQGIFEQEDVMQVAVYRADGSLLKVVGSAEKESPADTEATVKRLMERPSPTHHHSKDQTEFWAPVLYTQGRLSYEEGFFPESGGKPRVLGFAKVAMSRKHVVENTRAIALGTIAMTAIFVLVGGLVAYFMSRRITGPLKNLAQGIGAMKKEGMKSVSVEGDAEIMELADSFNDMSDTLRRGEEEKERVEAEKRKMEQMYHQAQKLDALGRLAGGISHDFNNILTIVLNNMELARMRSGEIVSEYIERTVEAVKRGKVMVENLLSFSTGGGARQWPTDLGTVVRETVELLGRGSNGEFDLDLRVMPGLWSVRANQSQLQQVVMNLYQNARDAIAEQAMGGGEKGRISVRVDNVVLPASDPAHGAPDGRTGEFIRLTVGDNGCGIDEAAIQRVYEPFFSTKEKHSGMGLSTVYGIVNQSGGWMNVESEPGSSAAVSVYLPRLHERAAPSPQLGADLLGGTETLLVSDDERHIADSIKEMLESLGYSVLVAYTGADALRLFEQSADSVDLVITDMVMPDLSGFELMSRIRQTHPDIPLIITSGDVGYGADESAAGFRKVSFLPKPFDLATLSLRVRESLGRGGGRKAVSHHLNRVKLYSVREKSSPYAENISDSATVYELFKHLASETREKFIAVFVDAHNRIIAYDEIAQGTLNEGVVYTHEVIRTALLTNASSVMLVHNHPSGDTEPSTHDLEITADILEKCKMFGIRLLDHLIIGRDGYFSLGNGDSNG
ncbi:MAG: JAB domain-containing protein [Nitrospirota bacterium]